jgi:hypothetical protein
MIKMKWVVNPLNFMSAVNGKIAAVTKEVSEEIFDGVVSRSPVDTGSFRASWNVSVGLPDVSNVVGGSSESPLSPPVFPKLNVKNADKVYITNNTPYGAELENGHSGQAPLGMVSVTLASMS